MSYPHNLQSSCILWREFDRDALERDNFIEANVLVHWRSLVDRFGDWDARLSCLNDWDIALSYTVDKPAHALNALAAYYCKCHQIRATDTGQQPTERETIVSKLAERCPQAKEKVS